MTTLDRTSRAKLPHEFDFRISVLIRAVLVILTLTLLVVPPASAKIKIISIDRASVVETTTNSSGAVSSITVYGGIAGDTSRCDVANSTTETCDNCRLLLNEAPEAAATDSLLLPCNQRRINPNLNLSITFSSDAVDGSTAITNSDGSAALTPATAGGSVGKGTTTTVTIPWSTICTRIFSDAGDSTGASSCEPASGSVSGSIRVGISAAGSGLLNAAGDDVQALTIKVRSVTGTSLATNCGSAGSAWQVCYFDMGPGDGKAIVKTLLGPSNVTFPATDYKAVRMLYAERGFNYISLASSHVDLPITATDTTNFKITPRRIQDLRNDITYFFKSALVDVAGNVSLYSPSTSDIDCANSPTPDLTTCRQVTPSEVVGVLDKSNCFIATAAYGSQFAGELDTLRDFRDQILMSSKAGRAFIRFYYEQSPRFAEMIFHSPVARSAVRGALIPVIWFAGFALNYGPLNAALMFLASLVVVAALIHLGRRLTLRRARRSLLPVIFGALLFPSVTMTPSVSFAAKWASRTSKTTQGKRANASTATQSARSLSALEDEAPPAPEYPYPGSQGAVQNLKKNVVDDDEFSELASSIEEDTSSPIENVDRKLTPMQRPLKVNEDGDYLYEKLPENEPHKHGSLKPKPFSKIPGRDAPSSIETSGEFTYPVTESEFTGAAGLRFGVMAPPAIKNGTNNLAFKDIYGAQSLLGLLFEYEYPLTRAIGRIGIKFESGLYFTQAEGRFLRSVTTNQSYLPEEKFTFVMVPLQAMIHYRFQYFDTQLFVPFVEGGAGYNGITELRDDNKPPRFGGSPVVIAGGGVNILLDWVDQYSIRQLDAEYGINHVWLTMQYRQIVGLKSDLDFSSNLISAGFTVDF